jgi:transcriptional/translational regulatory protein YebC/TACO1
MFERVGLIHYAADRADAEMVFDAALEAGAEDVESSASGHDVFCQPDSFNTVREGLEEALGEAETARLDWKPQNTVEVTEKDAETLLKLLDALEDSDDVQRVAANFEIPDDVMERLSA